MLPSSFVAFDIETTGFAPPCKIIEIGAVKVVDRFITEKYQQLVDPEVMIPWKITSLTGITDNMVTGAPKINTALQGFIDFIGGLPIAAHNAKFDMSFIQYYSNECGYQIKNEVIDTLKLSRKYIPGLPSYKLSIVARHLSADRPDAHRALSDAMMVAGIMLSLSYV